MLTHPVLSVIASSFYMQCGGDGTEVFGGCDVIAMTTHGYSGRQHWVGSVTEHVLDTSRLPLLIVQPGA